MAPEIWPAKDVLGQRSKQWKRSRSHEKFDLMVRYLCDKTELGQNMQNNCSNYQQQIKDSLIYRCNSCRREWVENKTICAVSSEASEAGGCPLKVDKEMKSPGKNEISKSTSFSFVWSCVWSPERGPAPPLAVLPLRKVQIVLRAPLSLVQPSDASVGSIRKASVVICRMKGLNLLSCS